MKCLLVQSGTSFDNILVTLDEQQAAEFAADTWGRKYDLERIALERELRSRGISDEPIDELGDDEGEGEGEGEGGEGEGEKDGYANHNFSLAKLWSLFSTELWSEWLREWAGLVNLLATDPKQAFYMFPLLSINTFLLILCLLYGTAWIIETVVRRTRGRLQPVVKKEPLISPTTIPLAEEIKRTERLDPGEYISAPITRPITRLITNPITNPMPSPPNASQISRPVSKLRSPKGGRI